MRREEFEVTDFREQLDILARCQVIRLGMYGGDYPYVIPLFFGIEEVEGHGLLYFHSAKEGLKRDLMAFNNRVCVEAEIFHGYVGQGHDMSADYESVLGFGTLAAVEGDMAIHGLKLLMEHCSGDKDYPAEDCPALPHTQVYQVSLDFLTAKRHLHKKEE